MGPQVDSHLDIKGMTADLDHPQPAEDSDLLVKSNPYDEDEELMNALMSYE